MGATFFPPLPPVDTDYDDLHRWLLTEKVEGAVLLTFSIPGTLVVGAGTLRIPITQTMGVTTVRATVNTAPTGADIIFDINRNGTTIFPTSTNPTIPVGTFDSGNTDADVVLFVAGDYLQVDVDQIGSSVAGADAVVAVMVIL